MKQRPIRGRWRDLSSCRSLIPLLCTGTLGVLVLDSSGASYSFDDLTEFDPLSSTPGWTASEADSFPTSPIAYVTSWDRPSIGTSLAGAVGGAFDVPAASSYGITYQTPLSLTTPAISPTITFDMAVFDSTSAYSGRDVFGFSVNDAAGTAFITAEFRPLVQSATPDAPLDPVAAWEVRYSIRGSGSVSTLVPLMESEAYTMRVMFTGAGVGFAFDTAGSSTLANEYFGTPFGYDTSTESIGSVSFNWLKSELNADFGDNIMVVDNITYIPEPGVASLAVIAAAVPLFIRRRRPTNL